MSEELSDVKTDIALIKKDVKQIERFFDKVDVVMSEMSDMTKSLAVQQKIIEHFDSKLQDIEVTMEEHKQEDIKRTEMLSKRLEEYRKSSKEDHQRVADESSRNREQRNKEIMTELAKLNGNLDRRMNDMEEEISGQEDRLRALENLKWWLLGAAAVIGIFVPILNSLDLSAFIG
jgi:exonuclease VII large subunit